MLMLSKLHNILERVLDLPDLHTAALLTVTGQLISYASDPEQSKDYVRVIVGIAMETWKETKGERFGMVETEKFGRVVVVPIDEEDAEQDDGDSDTGYAEDRDPLMLLALNATDAVELEELQERGSVVAAHLAKPLSRFRDHLKVKPIPPTPSALSPTPARHN